MKRVLASLMLSVPAVAFAHGDAAWIQRDPRYVTNIATSAGYSHCCGPADCEMAPEGAIRQSPAGWVIPSTGQVIPYSRMAEGRQAFYSIDGRPWWCRRWVVDPVDGMSKHQAVCIFVPGEAS